MGPGAVGRDAGPFRRPVRALALFVALTCLSCGAAADVDDAIPAQGETPRIVAPAGPLSPEESKRILERISRDAGAAGLLARHAAIEEAVAETPLVAGNRMRVLHDGPETFRAAFDLIRSARDHVNIEFYIMEDVESDGVRLGDLLVEKRREGVAVNVIYDSHGSQKTPPEFFERLRGAGIPVVEYNPLDPTEAGGDYNPNARTHRKIIVADGARAITGGINLSRTYQSTGGSGSSSGDAGESSGSGGEAIAATPDGKPALWRDTSVLVEGPVVAQFQRLFVEHWEAQNGPIIDQRNFFPEVPPIGDAVVRVIGSSPEDALPRYYVTVLSHIRNAEQRIWLTAAYFVPTEQEIEDLKAAAARGVDVRILVPGVSDIDIAVDIARSHYVGLMEAGIRIWEAHDVLLHSKTMVVDGVWSVIGSSNFDHRSVIFNDEVDAVLLGSETAQELERVFEADIAAARAIDLEAWRSRPLLQRVREHLSRLWERWL